LSADAKSVALHQFIDDHVNVAKPSVYVETSVISYLTARPSRDLVTAARQQVTRDWWDSRRSDFDLYCSDAVLQEVLEGDPAAAMLRERLVMNIPFLPVDEVSARLARTLLGKTPLPTNAAVDALHVSISAVNRITYLLTWNCAHLANAELRPRIEQVCRDEGHPPPIICTPDELMDIRA
jgi:predicted nucleic acid-binding protein